MKDAVLYYRVSSVGSDRQDTSYNLQSNFSSEDWNIIKKFGDKGTGTKVLNRPNFIQMLNEMGVDVEEHKKHLFFTASDREPICKNILVSHTSRFVRDKLIHQQILNALDSKGVTVHYLDLNIKSSDATVTLMLDIIMSLDQQEVANLKEKVNNGIAKARKQNNLLSVASSIYGFDYIAESNSLVKNKDSKIVAKMFNDYITGDYSYSKLAKKYGFTANRTHEILRNEKYCGYASHNKYINNKRNKDYTIFKHPRIEPIITLETYNKVKEIGQKRRCGTRPLNNSTYALSGKIRCSYCGKNYYRKYANGKGNLWSCQGRNVKACDSPSITEVEIIEFLLSYKGLDCYISNIDALIDIVLKEYHLQDIQDLKEQAEKVHQMKKKILDLYLMEKIDQNIYDEKLEQLEAEAETIHQRISDIENQNRYINEVQGIKEYHLNKMLEYKNMLSKEPQTVLKEVKQIVIAKRLEPHTEAIKADIVSIEFNGMESLNKLIGNLPFNDTGVIR